MRPPPNQITWYLRASFLRDTHDHVRLQLDAEALVTHTHIRPRGHWFPAGLCILVAGNATKGDTLRGDFALFRVPTCDSPRRAQRFGSEDNHAVPLKTGDPKTVVQRHSMCMIGLR